MGPCLRGRLGVSPAVRLLIELQSWVCWRASVTQYRALCDELCATSSLPRRHRSKWGSTSQLRGHELNVHTEAYSDCREFAARVLQKQYSADARVFSSATLQALS